MRFRKGATLDPSQVEDRRGQGGMPFPGGVAVGGGGLGLVALAIYLAIALLGGRGLGPRRGRGGRGPLGGLTTRSVGGGPPPASLSECQSGEAANTKPVCRIVGDVN